MNENVVKTMKTVTSFAGGIGIAAIIGNAVKHVSPTSGVGIVMKTCIMVGTALLGGLASDAASEYAERKIDKIASAISVEVKEDSEEETE